ncbi:MAG: DUF5320 domain-containing protein [Candidatus Hadarchaeales archaeon]
MRDWFGPWPGRGPFSYLPPWRRPGWLYGPGACWRLWWLCARYPPLPAELVPAEELKALEEYAKELRQELEGVMARIEELKGTKAEK